MREAPLGLGKSYATSGPLNYQGLDGGIFDALSAAWGIAVDLSRAV